MTTENSKGPAPPDNLGQYLATAGMIGVGVQLAAPNGTLALLDLALDHVVTEATAYAPYIEHVWLAGSVVADVDGVWLYEVAENFGVWYMHKLKTLPAGALPEPAHCRARILKLAVDVFGIQNEEHAAKLAAALNAVPFEVPK